MNITSTELKQKINLLQKLKEEDIVVTKRDKPFAVIIDYDKYNELIREKKSAEVKRKLDALNSLESFNLGGKDFAQIKSEME